MKLRVLVADDNKSTVILLSSIMEIYGHEVREVFDGHAAIAATHEFQPHLILLDIGMPGMNGFEVAKKIRERREWDKTVIVVVSAYGAEEDKEFSRKCGADYHLAKPADVREFKQILAAVVAGSKTPRTLRKTPTRKPEWRRLSNQN